MHSVLQHFTLIVLLKFIFCISQRAAGIHLIIHRTTGEAVLFVCIMPIIYVYSSGHLLYRIVYCVALCFHLTPKFTGQWYTIRLPNIVVKTPASLT